MGTTRNHWAWAALALVLIVSFTAIGSFQKLRCQDSADSSLFAYGGFLIEQGGRLYRDIWDHKPPGVYLVNAAAFRLAGTATWPVCVTADTLATLLAVAACGLVARRWTSLPGASWAAAVLAAFYLNLRAFHVGGGMAEVYMTALLAWAGWAFVASRSGAGRPGWLLALSGVLAGLAIICKPIAVTTVAACLLTLAIEAVAHRRPIELLRQGGLFLAGLSVPLALVALLFAWQGTLRQMVDASLLYNLSYIQQKSLGEKLRLHHLWRNSLLLGGFVLVLGGALLHWTRRRAAASLLFEPGIWRIFVPIWLLGEWMAAYVGKFDNGQYLLSCLVPLSCLAGAAAVYLWQSLRTPQVHPERWLAACCLVLSLYLLRLPVQSQWADTRGAAYREMPQLASDQLRVADWIRRQTGPEDRIWVWGYAPRIYLGALRHPATRFVFDGPFLNSGRILTQEFNEMLQQLDRSRPMYVVDACTTGWFCTPLADRPGRGPQLSASPYEPGLRQLRAWVTHWYAPAADYGEITIYRRRTAGEIVDTQPSSELAIDKR